jgi:hypothetical protein
MTNYTNSSNKDGVATFLNKPQQNQSFKPKLLSLINESFQLFLKSLSFSNELRVWQGYDRLGNEVWHAFDPVTGKHTSLDSEAEMRDWLEKRYYQ